MIDENTTIGRNTCEKLPYTKDEIIAQWKINKVYDLDFAVRFMSGVRDHGRWNQQTVTKEYLLEIHEELIKAFDALNEAGHITRL